MRQLWVLGALSACSFNEQQLPDGGGPIGDDASQQVECVDRFEPNDSPRQPTVFDTTDLPVELVDLAICPAGDQDVFLLPVEMNDQSMDIRLVRDGPAGIEVTVLDINGLPVGAGEEMGNETKLCLPNVPMGLYFVTASKATDTKYRITFALRASCQ